VARHGPRFEVARVATAVGLLLAKTGSVVQAAVLVLAVAVPAHRDPVEAFIDALRELKADVRNRYERLSGLPVDVCPEGNSPGTSGGTDQ